MELLSNNLKYVLLKWIYDNVPAYLASIFKCDIKFYQVLLYLCKNEKYIITSRELYTLEVTNKYDNFVLNPNPKADYLMLINKMDISNNDLAITTSKLLKFTIENDNFNIFKYLLRKYFKNIDSLTFFVIVQDIIANDRYNMLKYMINNIKYKDKTINILKEFNPLCENINLIKLVLSYHDHIDLNVALDEAVDIENISYVKYILSKGADVHYNNDILLERALEHGSESKNYEMLKLLLKYV